VTELLFQSELHSYKSFRPNLAASVIWTEHLFAVTELFSE